MFYTKITYRQRGPNGQDLPLSQCETTVNGPFSDLVAAQHFASSVANVTPLFRVIIEPATVGEEEKHV